MSIKSNVTDDLNSFQYDGGIMGSFRGKKNTGIGIRVNKIHKQIEKDRRNKEIKNYFLELLNEKKMTRRELCEKAGYREATVNQLFSGEGSWCDHYIKSFNQILGGNYGEEAK